MFSAELKRIREERGLTLDHAADLIGVSRQYVSMIERGLRQYPSIKVVCDMARVYQVPMIYLKLHLENENATVVEIDALTEWYMKEKKDVSVYSEYLAVKPKVG